MSHLYCNISFRENNEGQLYMGVLVLLYEVERAVCANMELATISVAEAL